MVSKIKKIQIFRHITQIVSLFALPGLYLLALEQLKSIYQMIIGGNFDFLSAATSSIELITIIVSTIVIGRFFCGWFCSFGALNDLMYYLIKDADELLKSLSSSDWETSAQLTQFDNIQTVYLSTYELIKKSLASRLKGASIVQSI